MLVKDRVPGLMAGLALAAAAAACGALGRAAARVALCLRAHRAGRPVSGHAPHGAPRGRPVADVAYHGFESGSYTAFSIPGVPVAEPVAVDARQGYLYAVRVRAPAG